MQRRPAFPKLALILAALLAAGLGGCSAGNQLVEDVREGHFMNKPFIQKPDWAQHVDNSKVVHLNPPGTVKPDELVSATGDCAPQEAPVVAAAPQPAPAQQEAEQTPAAPPKETPSQARAQALVGSMAGDLASAPMPQGPPPAPPPKLKPTRLASAKPGAMDQLQPEAGAATVGLGGGAPVLGGISLGMTECEAVRRAGHPSHVVIEAGKKGERQVVLTYLSGPWPGIYTFDSGRLKVVDAVPGQLNPVQPVKKKKRTRRVTSRTPPTSKKEDVYVQ